jgi:Putative Actinobacterial Holin-X, holin superfamily III
MESSSASGEKTNPAALGASAPNDAGLLDEVRSLWRELHGLAHDQFALAALEVKLAGVTLVRMVIAGVMVAVLLVSCWLGLVGAAVLWLINEGTSPSIAVLLAVAVNLALAVVLCDRIRQQSGNLQFPWTVRGLRPTPPSLQDSEKSRWPPPPDYAPGQRR